MPSLGARLVNQSDRLLLVWGFSMHGGTYSDDRNGVESVIVKPVVQFRYLTGIREIGNSSQKLFGKRVELRLEVEEGVPLV